MSLSHLRARWKFRLERMSPGPERRILRDLLHEWDENTVAALGALSEDAEVEEASEILRTQADALAGALALFVQGVDEFWSVPGRAKEATEKARSALAAYRSGSRGADEGKG